MNVKLADYCYIEPSLVTLERGARDQLSSDDWKALIASELCYKFAVKPLGHRDFVLRTALPVCLAFGLLEVLIFIFTLPYVVTGEWFGRPLGLVLIISAIFIAAVILAKLALPGAKRDRREADKVAAEIVGKNKLLQALRTAETLGMQDPARARRLRSSIMNLLSERERINNLETWDPHADSVSG